MKSLWIFSFLFTLPLAAQNWTVSGDFLFWFASEETVSVWASDLAVKFKDECISSTFREKDISFNWAPGFRVGVGRKFTYDAWDTELSWTWLRPNARDKTSKGKHIVLPEFFCGFMNGDIADHEKIKWTILFNMFDWELGRNHLISKYLSFRPFIGVKGGWIHQTIHSKWHVVAIKENGMIFPANFNATEDLKNNFWGVGPMGGLNSQWKLGSIFSLLGDFSFGALFGSWSFKDNYRNPTPKTISLNINQSSLGALMLKGFLGLGGDTDFGKTHFSTRLGYEMQIWFSQAQFPTFQQLCVRGDLTLQGVTLNCRLDF